jgi:hypothetical protein
MSIVDQYVEACRQVRTWVRRKKQLRDQMLSGTVSLVGDNHIATITPRVTIRPRDKAYPFLSEMEKEKEAASDYADWLSL